MAIFKVVISDPKSRRTAQKDVDQSAAVGLIGKKIGEEFNGDIIGLSGYTLQITGGTDKDGFPMHSALKGSGRKKMLLTNPPGFHTDHKGQRRRKMVCGNTISDSIVQINAKVVKAGAQKFEEAFAKKEEPVKEEEAPAEEAKPAAEEKPAEKKPKEKPKKKPKEEPKAEEKKEEPKEAPKEEVKEEAKEEKPAEDEIKEGE